MKIVWQKLIEVDQIVLSGISFCKFLNWVGSTDPDWVKDLEAINWVSLDILHQYICIKGVFPRIVSELIWV